LKEVVERLEK